MLNAQGMNDMMHAPDRCDSARLAFEWSKQVGKRRARIEAVRRTLTNPRGATFPGLLHRHVKHKCFECVLGTFCVIHRDLRTVNNQPGAARGNVVGFERRTSMLW